MSGIAASGMGLMDDNGQTRQPSAADIRAQVEVSIFLGIATALVVLWFIWLRHSVRRWRITRRYGSGSALDAGAT